MFFQDLLFELRLLIFELFIKSYSKTHIAWALDQPVRLKYFTLMFGVFSPNKSGGSYPELKLCESHCTFNFYTHIAVKSTK